MNDFKNILLAYFSSLTSVLAAVETRTLITIISAIVLPILFFSIGKTIDVMLQIYLHRELGRHKSDEN
ncbi:hypothetical protein [Leptolyngbya sp. 7M]|uniref:hypothetical protein n=1 Tax=Leptolyngbya sp. 7M TaxID=2812896 RepID=UPI001B8D1413|nr:hypothetical protein [Leptolyngbya sp. 7M]QYO65519.1 hypothetical protein JVX88_01660 [Leptolyngbya sp. 7M]